MAKVIIGIHGLANKPPEETLKQWWRQSIVEGLQKNNGHEPTPNFEFRMVYWANLLYKYPQHDDGLFSFDKLYNGQPYVEAQAGALKEYKTSLLDKVRAGAFDVVGDALDYLKFKHDFDGVADWILGKVMKDLAFYYDDHRKIANRAGEPELARKVLRDELKTAIRADQDNEIMLIAHSMGTIIAYDVLRDLGQSDPDLQIPYFVTMGSPLGLPHVKGKIIQERDYDPDVRTPSIVTKSWRNYADKDDKVSFDIHLHDDYGENRNGIRVVDDLVANDYHAPGPNGKGNPHKSYGYLRTPEISRHIREFLESV
ncbi:MAG: alpha/beta hydrolase [bacterium]